jgi:hypothetical protein
MVVNINLPLFVNFSPNDLERLKNDERWLSDAHLTLSLLYVPFYFFEYINLMDAGIVFEIVKCGIFGGIAK